MKVIKTSDPEIVNEAASLMRRGAITVFPTDTVYGLGTNASKENDKNVKQIFKIKERPYSKPLSVLITKKMVHQYIEAPGDIITGLENIWPAAITFIVNWKKSRLEELSPHLNKSGSSTIACRVPTHNVLLSIIEKLNIPIVGTSANTSGHQPSIIFSDVLKELPTKDIELWIDQGTLPKRSPSTIIDITNPDEPKIIREGDFKFNNFRS